MLSIEDLLALPEYVKGIIEPCFIPMPPGGGGGNPPPMPAPVNTMVIVDDDALAFFVIYGPTLGGGSGNAFEWAINILEAGDDPFWSSFNIDFVASDIRYWESPNTTPVDIYSLMAWVMTTFPTPSGIDVRYVLTGQNTWPFGGLCYDDTFIISAWAAILNFQPLQNLWQHEASHLYHVGDHAITDFTPCVMNYWYPFLAFWCSGCSSTIYANRFHLD